MFAYRIKYWNEGELLDVKGFAFGCDNYYEALDRLKNYYGLDTIEEINYLSQVADTGCWELKEGKDFDDILHCMDDPWE